MSLTWNQVKKKGSSHYKRQKTEPIDLMKEFGILEGFALGNIIKYACRYKAGDVEKIIHYGQMLKVLDEERKKSTV